MFLVTGGCGSNEMWNYDTTETFDPSVGSWVLTEAKLPRPVYEPRAANINGRVLIFGNDNPNPNIQPKQKSLKWQFHQTNWDWRSSSLTFRWHLIINTGYLIHIAGGCDTDLNTFDDILEYVPEEDTIIPVGKMIETRYNHAVSVVPAEDYLQWCTF